MRMTIAGTTGGVQGWGVMRPVGSRMVFSAWQTWSSGTRENSGMSPSEMPSWMNAMPTPSSAPAASDAPIAAEQVCFSPRAGEARRRR